MAEVGKPNATPRLRFPEFRDAKEWEEERLADLCLRIMDGTHFSPKTKQGPRLYLTSRNIQDGKLDLSSVAYISEEEHREIYDKCPVVKGDVLLTKDGANTGNCAINILDFEFSLLSSVAVLRGKPEVVSQAFLYQSIDSDRTQRLIEDSMSGQAITRITLEKIGNFKIPITARAEQQKIADCLTSLDEVIAGQGRKAEALKALKLGLMQQLFPREGETVPCLRFLEFRDGPEWEEKRLEDVAPLQRGFDLPSSELVAGHVPVVYSNGIRSYHEIGMARGPGLVTGRSGTIGNLHYIEDGDYWPHNTSLWVTTFKGHHPRFVYYLYAAIGLDRFASGSGVPTLNRNDVHAYEARVPASEKEQQRIADCLSSLDVQIAAESEKLDALKIHKRGLMQRLFPSPEDAET